MDPKLAKDIYSTYSRKLYNTSLRIVGRVEEAEECMQDSIIRYLRHLDEGGERLDGGRLDLWLGKTCVRLSLDLLRRRRREDSFLRDYALGEEEDDEADSMRREAISSANLQADAVKKAISSLKDPYRLVLTLILVEGLDYEEISSYTGIKEETLRSHYSRGKTKLLSLLGKEMKK